MDVVPKKNIMITEEVNLQITTENGTPTILYGINASSDNLYIIEAKIFGYKADFSNTIVANAYCVYLVKDGVVTEITENITKNKSAGFTDSDVDFAVNGQTINCVVTGLSDQEILWDSKIVITSNN